jgi:hypothetical protein
MIPSIEITKEVIIWKKKSESKPSQDIYREKNQKWYKGQSKAPIARPGQIKEEQKNAIILTRNRLEAQRFAQVGVSAIKWELNKQGIQFPSDSTMNRVLKREGLVKKNFIYPQGG